MDGYCQMYERVRNYVSNNSIQSVAIKASAVGQTKPTLSHLHSAELRGVICVASKIANANVYVIQKAVVSRTFGSRKVDDYVSDDEFWEQSLVGDVAKSRREAALIVMSQMERRS